MNGRKAFFNTKLELKSRILFLDRDGVLNTPTPGDYSKNPDEFDLFPYAIDCLILLQKLFHKLVIVTNQQGISKGVMTDRDLENVHLKLLNELKSKGGSYPDLVLYAPYLAVENNAWRKPDSGMVRYAKKLLTIPGNMPCVMVGDAPTDMEMGRKINATCVRISNPQFDFTNEDLHFTRLVDFCDYLEALPD